jgi:hypothetical protein
LSQKRTGGGNTEQEEVVIDGPFLAEEEEIEPFDWEDYLYESWLEEKRERSKPADAGI